MNEKTVHSARLTYAEEPEAVLRRLLGKLPPLEERVGPGDKVLLKPNFVAPFPAATTDFRFLRFFIEEIRAAKATPVIGESSGFEFDTRRTTQILGLPEFLEENDVEFIDFEKADFDEVDLGPGLPVVQVARAAREAKLVVNLPVLKGHTITKVTGAVKNLFGLLSKHSRRKLHCRKLEPAIAALARQFPDALHFVDARNLLTRAVFGETQPLDYCLAGDDPFALDNFGSRLLGIDPGEVKYLQPLLPYRVDGPSPDSFGGLSKKNSLKERAHRAFYSAFYWLDRVKCGTVGGESILPSLHWTLGVHPVLGPVSDEDLRRLEEICPIGAVDAAKRRIKRDLCMQARCLKCYRESPPGVVRLGGLNPPKRGKDDG